MQQNGDLIAPMLKARDDLQHDLEGLLGAVAQRRKALDTLSSAIDIMRALPDRVDVQARPQKTSRGGPNALPDRNRILEVAMSLDGRFKPMNVVDSLVAQGLLERRTSYVSNQVSAILNAEPDMFVGTGQLGGRYYEARK